MTTVEKIKAKILDLAIRGKLVPQDPNDEPASVLLERIKAEKAELVKAKKIKKDKNPSEIIISSDGVPYEKFADGTSKDLSDEISFDLPRGWAWARVKYVTAIKRGEYVTRKQIREGKIPVILGGQEPAYYCDRSNHDGPCVVVSRSGASAGFASYWDEPIFVTDGFLFECAKGLEARYFYYWLKSFPLVKLQRGTGMPHVQSEVLNALFLPLPPLAEQKRIVAKVEELFAYADQIGSASEEITKTAQRLDKKILDLAIRGKLVQQDPNDEPASELVKRIEKQRQAKTDGKKSRAAASHKPTYEIEPPFDIPDSWEWVRLGDVVQFMSGNTPSKDVLVSEGIPYFKVAEMNLPGNECVLKQTSLYVSKAATIKKFPKGTIVFPKNGGAMLTNKKRILGQESVCDLNTGGLKSYIEDMTDYLFLWFGSIDLGKYVKGGVIPTTNVDKLRTTPIPLPPLAEQERIVKKIDELKEMTQALVAL